MIQKKFRCKCGRLTPPHFYSNVECWICFKARVSKIHKFNENLTYRCADGMFKGQPIQKPYRRRKLK